jgi:lipopolysaccharide transport system ATP-binding protein
MSRSGSDEAVLASIDVRDLSLVVPYYAQPDRVATSWLATLFGAAVSVPRRRFATLLDDISFTIREGERVALIGRNGAGKSTLLRVLAGAFEPTGGKLQINGSRQALLSIGIGFNNEATVMENIYLRATAMGVASADIRYMVEPVLEFSELRKVADRRLFTLSSGQRMRLGFAISTAVPTDIMLLDEWFGAGDAQFLRRARKRMTDRMNGSRIVVLASHNETLLHKLCNRAIFIDEGKLVFDGSVAQTLAEYHRLYPSIDQEALAASERKRMVKKWAALRRAAAHADEALASADPKLTKADHTYWEAKAAQAALSEETAARFAERLAQLLQAAAMSGDTPEWPVWAQPGTGRSDPAFWEAKAEKVRQTKETALLKAAKITKWSKLNRAATEADVALTRLNPTEPAYWQAKAAKAALSEERSERFAARLEHLMQASAMTGDTPKWPAWGQPETGRSDPAFWKAKAERARQAKERAGRRARKMAKLSSSQPPRVLASDVVKPRSAKRTVAG